MLNNKHQAVKRIIANYQEKKFNLEKHYLMGKKDKRRVNILRTIISASKSKLITRQMANKKNNLYHHGIMVVWKLDFLLYNRCPDVKKAILDYKKNSILLNIAEIAPSPNLKKINSLKISINFYKKKLMNYQINYNLNSLSGRFESY